jgi:phosphomannomutase
VPTVDALRREGIDYRGVLFAGLMLTHSGPKVLEFNCRFGDPETQALMMRWQGDLLDALWRTAEGTLDGADIGFAHDADGERLGLVTGSGIAMSEETTLTLATSMVLSHTPGTVVTNMSTTRAIDVVAARHASVVVRTPVGQSYISEAMLQHNAVIGGEGNGGVALPRVLMSHDAAATQGLILEHLARTGLSLQDALDGLPVYPVAKHDVPVKPSALYSVLQSFREQVEADQPTADTTDGMKISWPDGWVHVRASQTESMIRIIAEADSAARARDLLDWARDRLKA